VNRPLRRRSARQGKHEGRRSTRRNQMRSCGIDAHDRKLDAPRGLCPRRARQDDPETEHYRASENRVQTLRPECLLHDVHSVPPQFCGFGRRFYSETMRRLRERPRTRTSTAEPPNGTATRSCFNKWLLGKPPNEHAICIAALADCQDHLNTSRSGGTARSRPSEERCSARAPIQGDSMADSTFIGVPRRRPRSTDPVRNRSPGLERIPPRKPRIPNPSGRASFPSGDRP
jgi:hypothetical protein